MKKNKILGIATVGLVAIGLLAACTGDGTTSKNDPSLTTAGPTQTTEQTPTTAPTQTSEKIELKWKSAVLSATEVEGQLRVKAEINGTVGKIYYAITTTATEEPRAADIVTGSVAGTVKSGNSGTATLIDELVTLEAGAEYTCYFVIENNKEYSTIQTKFATTKAAEVNKGLGTSEEPFIIDCVEDLEHVGEGVYSKYNLEWNADSHYALAADIDLSAKYGEGKASWTPLELNGGSLDGAGYTISGLYINDQTASANLGLFSRIDLGTTVKNLTLDNVSITAKAYTEKGKNADNADVGTASGVYVGALTGDLKGAVDNIDIKNATLTITGTRAGGIAGRAYADEGSAISVTNCSVSATITGVGRLGGIVGLVDCKDKANFELPVYKNLVFNGSISGTSDTTTYASEGGKIDGQYIGGIAGYFRAAKIENVVVNAAISGAKHVGGIVGFEQKRSANDKHLTSVTESIFAGSLAVESGSNAGAIVGNKSTGNGGNAENVIAEGYYLETVTSTVETPSSTVVMGTKVTVAELTADWYAQNLEGFDFVNTFEIDQTTGLPKLK